MSEIDVGKVAMIPIADIEIEERAREVMGDLEELRGSLRKSGLAQPICVKECSDGKPYMLLAGERRLAVLMHSNNEVVPARIYPGDISPIECKSIELAENFFRKDFEHWEYDKLIAEIHELQQEIHGEKTSTAPDATGWGLKETAQMAGFSSKSTVSDAIKRHEARKAFPELFEGCKTQKDAMKMLGKLSEGIIKETIAKKIETGDVDISKRKLMDSFILGDFFEGVKKIPDHSVHMVEIDPPYGIALPEQKKKDGESRYALDDYNEVDSLHYRSFLMDVFCQCHRVMAEHSWLICWFAPEPWFETVYQALLETGFGATRMCGIWTKGTSGQNMNPTIRLANCYEMFFYAWKGQPALNKAGRGNEFHCSPVPATQKTHPTERPVELMMEIYDTFAFKGSRIMIPFLGSGSGLLAAHELGMSAFGYELGKGYRDSFLVKVHNM